MKYGKDWWVARGTGKAHTCVRRDYLADDYALFTALCGKRFTVEEVYETEEQMSKAYAAYSGCSACERKIDA